jgi:DNA-binding transcriptional ArsR family regulator
MPVPAPLDPVFAALANPTRRAILDRLARGEATVNELAAPFDLSQPTISSHLCVLEEAGLITRGRAANTRPVRLAPDRLAEAYRWIGGYARFWEDGLARLEDYAKTLQQKDNPDGPKDP